MINKTNYVKLILSAALFFVLLCSGNNSLAQGRDRSKFQGGYIDTSLSYLDSSLIKDSTRIRMPVDSTARVKNFKY
ncbi:MAG: hypothetical protein IT281_05785, partial [Ignavibacteria bacterium]|nr:hypothetical protein [Ignavibacteria bacterium]